MRFAISGIFCYNKGMTRAEKREKRREVARQNKEFAQRLMPLFAKRYRASLRYEDSLIKEDGKAYVNVDLTKLDSPFSVFSYDKRIDPEIYSYIDQSVYYLRAAIPVVINFDDGGKYTEDLKNKIAKAVKRHYTLEYEDKRLEHRKSIIFAAILAMVGVLFLTVHFILMLVFNTNDIINEVTLIMSWMFVWQSCDFFFISGHNKREEIYNSGQLALAEVTFGKPQ